MMGLRASAFVVAALTGSLLRPGAGWADSARVPPPDGQTTLAPVDADHLIVPGESVGPLYLGQGEDDVIARLGSAPDDSKAFDPDHHYSYWQKQGLIVGFEKDRVVMIGVQSKDYVTAGGIRVGMPGVQARAFFPSLVEPPVKGLLGLTDDSLGINFLKHPVDKHGNLPASYALPAGWTIDEINVFPSSDPVVVNQVPVASSSIAPVP